MNSVLMFTERYLSCFIVADLCTKVALWWIGQVGAGEAENEPEFTQNLNRVIEIVVNFVFGTSLPLVTDTDKECFYVGKLEMRRSNKNTVS